MRRIALSLLFLTLSIVACSRAPVEVAAPSATLPRSLWDHRPEAEQWTKSALAALNGHGAALVGTVPRDIDKYCPGYRVAGTDGRAAFWVHFLSALAKHESTWRPEASGGEGRWHGLLQISPATARGYGCRARTADDLKDGGLNLACGIRIMAVTVPRDGVISQGMRGVAADWGPFHQETKRLDIQAATLAQPQCAR